MPRNFMWKKLPDWGEWRGMMPRRCAQFRISWTTGTHTLPGTFCLGVALALAMPAPLSAAQKNIGLTSFDSVELHGPYQLIISIGTSVGANADGPQPALDKIAMEVDGDRLIIRERRDGADQVRRDVSGPVIIRLRAPRISSVAVVGSGSVSVSGLRGKALELTVNGSGRIDASIVASDALSISTQGAGSIILRGRATNLRAAMLGSGSIDTTALLVRQADIHSDGGGSGLYRADEFATITAAGSGSVRVAGKGYCRIVQDGGADIQCTGRILPAKK